MLRIRYAVELPETPLHFNFRYKGDSVGRSDATEELGIARKEGLSIPVLRWYGSN